MAEIINNRSRSGKSSHLKKASTRVDLTPMVDLGFLLITFFIFTTSMSQPKALKLKYPKDSLPSDSMQISESKSLNIILGENNRIFYYKGTALGSIIESNYGEGIRRVIEESRTAVKIKYTDPHELVILIKPMEGSSYRNVVSMLDEMLINDVNRYIITTPSKAEIMQIGK